MIQLDYKSGVPIYDQLANGIIRLKMWGVLKPDEPLPSVRQLAQKMSINPNTVQRAYRMLEEKGVIYSVSGKGSFITSEADCTAAVKLAAAEQFKKAISDAKQLGLTNEELINIINESEVKK